ncbi:hypothetical protein ACM66B_004476 [Microbotryomycetes sp. NB124-2]
MDPTSSSHLDGLLPLSSLPSAGSTWGTGPLDGDQHAQGEITVPQLDFGPYDNTRVAGHSSLIGDNDGFDHALVDPALGGSTHDSNQFQTGQQSQNSLVNHTDLATGPSRSHLGVPTQLSESVPLFRSPKIVVSQEAKAADLKASEKRRRKAEGSGKLKAGTATAAAEKPPSEPKKRGRPKGVKDKPRDPADPNTKRRGRPPGGKNKPRHPDDPRPGPGRPPKYPPGTTEREKRKVSKAARLARKAAAANAATASSAGPSSAGEASPRPIVEPGRNANGDYLTDDVDIQSGAGLLDPQAYPPPPSLESGMLEFQRNLAAQQAEAVRAATAAANLEDDDDDDDADDDVQGGIGHAGSSGETGGMYDDIDLLIDPAIRLQNPTLSNGHADILTGFDPAQSSAQDGST